MRANVARTRTRLTRRPVLPHIILAGIVALVAANAVARLAFAALGQTPAQPAWFSVVMLHLFTGIAGAGAASRVILGLNSRAGTVGMYGSGLCSGALIGFFYVGDYFNRSVQAAIAGAIAGAVLVVLFSWVARRPMAGFIPVMGAIAAYGFAFLIWTTAVAYLTTGQYAWGLGLGSVALAYVGFIVAALHTAKHELSQ